MGNSCMVYHMATNKRHDKELNLIVTLLIDIHLSHRALFNKRSLRNTTKVVQRRFSSEGMSFLTKTLPKLGKAFDKALSGAEPLNASKLRLASKPGSELPIFMGEFFEKVLSRSGTVLQDSCADHVRVIRQVCYLFYKYKLDYTRTQEQQVIDKFVKTDRDLSLHTARLAQLSNSAWSSTYTRIGRKSDPVSVVRRARLLLERVFSGFSFTDIVPGHGPGSVATRQQLWNKFNWTNVSARIRRHWPLDEYFYSSLGHVCDSLDSLTKVADEDLPARVILVPKDSRGPRLISAEPVDYQWIQQGIMRRLVTHIESLQLTRYNVFFTDQGPNGRGALLGSSTGRYATLDLNEASDRVSLSLVRLLFPTHVCEYLEAARSAATTLPNGDVIPLNKYAPMGSALCFPVLALTVWSILTAAAPDRDTRESILVYGDDVIVPTAFALNAIEQLESFGLKVNRDKSCISGFFRESCGVDAFKGLDVTPARIRSVWSSTPSANTYTSWIAYANSFYDKGYLACYDYIVAMLRDVYHEVPEDSMSLTCPSLREVPAEMRPKRSRINRSLQKREWLVRDVKSPVITHEMNGWSMLLRYFTSGCADSPFTNGRDVSRSDDGYKPSSAPFAVRSYTRRRTSMLVRRWR